MAKLFKLTLATSANREVNVVAENQEEAQTKVQLQEGETLSAVEDLGDVVA